LPLIAINRECNKLDGGSVSIYELMDFFSVINYHPAFNLHNKFSTLAATGDSHFINLLLSEQH